MDQPTHLRTHWKTGDLIRHKKTGHPLSVIQVFKDRATIVVDLEDQSPMPISYAILPRQYKMYAVDEDMEHTATGWTYVGKDML